MTSGARTIIFIWVKINCLTESEWIHVCCIICNLQPVPFLVRRELSSKNSDNKKTRSQRNAQNRNTWDLEENGEIPALAKFTRAWPESWGSRISTLLFLHGGLLPFVCGSVVFEKSACDPNIRSPKVGIFLSDEWWLPQGELTCSRFEKIPANFKRVSN